MEVALARAGHKVLSAFRAQEAIELLVVADASRQPTVEKTLLDGTMPDAYDVLAFIRTHPSIERSWVGVLKIRSEAERDLWESRLHRPDEIFLIPPSPINLFR